MKLALKHGENPHQTGTIVLDEMSPDPLALSNYTTPGGEMLSSNISQLSWITLTDLSRGVETLVRTAAAFETNTGRVPMIALLLQHGNCCGAAAGATDDVLHHAIDSNYRASFGAFLVTNIPITKDVALRLRQWMPAQRPFSGIAAPYVDPKAVGFFERKTGTCHIFCNAALARAGVSLLDPTPQNRGIRGATLSQATNTFLPAFPETWEASLRDDMSLAWGVCAASLNSNCIAIANDGRLIANAVGQPCRTGACELAILQAGQAGHSAMLKGAAVASDSFFAFADGIDMLARKKVRAIFATSGSIYDKEIADHAQQFDVIFHTLPDGAARTFSGH